MRYMWMTMPTDLDGYIEFIKTEVLKTEEEFELLDQLVKKMKEEGNYHSWLYGKKYFCEIKRHHTGFWCGHVWIPVGHPAHGMHFYDMQEKYPELRQVHGGLTSCSEFTYSDMMGFYGFDTGHAFDLNIATIHFSKQLAKRFVKTPFEMTYKDKQFVIRETKKLAELFDNIKKRENTFFPFYDRSI